MLYIIGTKGSKVGIMDTDDNIVEWVNRRILHNLLKSGIKIFNFSIVDRWADEGEHGEDHYYTIALNDNLRVDVKWCADGYSYVMDNVGGQVYDRGSNINNGCMFLSKKEQDIIIDYIKREVYKN